MLLFLALCAAGAATASLPAGAAGPPLPLPFVPDTAQQRAQTQLMIQQAQAQARLAASQARVQAQLDANQGRLEAQLKAEQAGTQAQLEGAGQQAATAAALADLSLPVAAATQAPLQSPPGTMELAALTPQLGRYFGADRGVLVVRAPAHGVLKLRDGDVILTIGGRVPATSSQAMRILTSYDAGEKIRLVVLREHRRIDISGTLPALPVLREHRRIDISGTLPALPPAGP